MFHTYSRFVGGLALIGSVMLLPSTALADTIDFKNVGHASTVSISGVRNGTFAAGELNWAWIGTAPEGFASSFYSYCVDVTQNLQDPQNVTVRSSTGFTNSSDPNGGAKAAWLFNEYAAGIRSSVDASANTMAAALQVAIWEAMYDSTYNSTSLQSGNFVLNNTTDSQIRGYANTYLTALYAAGVGAWNATAATVLDTTYGQDQITKRVSEPSTLLLMGVAFLVFANRVRRQTTTA